MGHNVIVIDPSKPIESGFNVLNWIDSDSPEADDNVASVVQWIAGDDHLKTSGRTSDDFFASQGRALVTCLLSDLVFDPDLPRAEQIGRASCRERVCQYG